MTYDVDALPDDVEQLKLLIVTLSQANAKQQETLDQQNKTLDQLVAEVSRLNVYIQQLLEIIYGKKSEKLPKEKPKEESSATSETPENTDSNKASSSR